MYTHTHTHTHTGIHSVIKKELNFGICSNMDGVGGHYAKWNKSDREKQTLYDITLELKKSTTNRNITKGKQTRRYRKQISSSSDDKESAWNARDPGLIPGSGRSSREGNGYPLQYSFLGNPMERGTWWATVHGVAKGQTWLTLSFFFHCGGGTTKKWEGGRNKLLGVR